MSTMEVESASKENVENTTDDSLNTEQPTAFILKLFEMINGAPDEVIAVSDGSRTFKRIHLDRRSTICTNHRC
jgi:hypothetical protein